MDEPRGDDGRARCPDRLLSSAAASSASRWPRRGRSLGSSVTLVEAVDRVLATEEPFASEQVAAGARGRRGRGPHGRQGESASRAARAARSRCGSRAATSCAATSSWSPSAARPRTAELGLETVGVEAGGYLEVDDQLRVGGSEWLYAIGDVNGRSLLTHMGKYQARICADHILGRDVAARADKARLAAGRVHRAAARARSG